MSVGLEGVQHRASDTGTGVAKHTFCKTCGIHSFYTPRSDPDKVDVNVRCLDGVDLSAIKTKPFAFVELLARIEALSRRRSSVPDATKLKVADLDFDLLARRVTRGGREIELTARELKLLEFLMRRAGQVVTRTMLLEGVWDLHFDPQSNLIDVHISRLRQAIDRGSDRQLIHTIRGSGYVLRTED